MIWLIRSRSLKNPLTTWFQSIQLNDSFALWLDLNTFSKFTSLILEDCSSNALKSWLCNLALFAQEPQFRHAFSQINEKRKDNDNFLMDLGPYIPCLASGPIPILLLTALINIQRKALQQTGKLDGQQSHATIDQTSSPTNTTIQHNSSSFIFSFAHTVLHFHRHHLPSRTDLEQTNLPVKHRSRISFIPALFADQNSLSKTHNSTRANESATIWHGWNKLPPR